MKTANEFSRKHFLDYRAFFYQRHVQQARSSRVSCALAYAMYPKESEIDYESLSAAVALNIQRDITGLPYQDPKYKHYCRTIAKLLATSEELDHVLYSLMFWHSIGDELGFRTTLYRCLDVIEIYSPSEESKKRLKNFMALVRRMSPGLGEGADLDPTQRDFNKSLYLISVNFFKLEV